MSEPNVLLLLSEGFCPFGHGQLTGRGYCVGCDAKWRIRRDVLLQVVSAERKISGDVHGVSRSYIAPWVRRGKYAPDWMRADLEHTFLSLPAGV